MNVPRHLALAVLLSLAGSAFAQQNTLFSTATTAPLTNAPAAGPRAIAVTASGGHTLTLTNNLVLATFRKDVSVNDPEFFLHSQTLHLVLDSKAQRPGARVGTNAPPAGTATNAAPPMGHMNSFVQIATADGGVLLSNKLDGSFAVANRAVYFATNDIFELEGNAFVVKRFNAESSITNTAPRILYLRASRQFVFEGLSTLGGDVTPGASSTKPASPAPKQP
jgi:lipopolysaccharide export system protein LptA